MLSVPNSGPTKLSLYVIPHAMTALRVAADQTGLSRTDTANRALQVYATLIGVPWWRAIQVLFQERAQLRKFAAELETDVRPTDSDGSDDA